MTNAFLYQEIKIVVATHLELFCRPIKMKLLLINVRISVINVESKAKFSFNSCQKYEHHINWFPNYMLYLI